MFWGLFDPERRAARRQARSYFRSQRPHLKLLEMRPRATEPDRWVFVAFHTDPEHPVKPTPYDVIAVDRDTGDASFIEFSPDSPYWYPPRR